MTKEEQCSPLRGLQVDLMEARTGEKFKILRPGWSLGRSDLKRTANQALRLNYVVQVKLSK